MTVLVQAGPCLLPLVHSKSLVLSQGRSLDAPQGWSWSGLGLPWLHGNSAMLAVGMAEGLGCVWEPQVMLHPEQMWPHGL